MELIWYFKIFLELCWLIVMVLYLLLKSWVEFFYVKRKDLSGEIVLLTGAAGGMGTLLSKKLAAKGCTLILLDIDEKVHELASSINQSTDTNKAFAFSCDITKVEELKYIAGCIVNSIGHPSMIINNAGTLAGKYWRDMSYYDVNKTFNVNTLAHYSILECFLPRMLKENHGHIVSISSILAMTPAGGLCDYAASKAASTAFMHSLRQEIRLLRKDNVHVTNILPFQVNTELFRGCESRFPRFPFMSVQDPSYVTDKMIEAIEKNQISVYIPRILYVMCSLYHILPASVFDVIYDFFQVNTAMKTHVGRSKSS